MGRILLNRDHYSKGKIMLTALDSSNAVLIQFLMIDGWDCSPHHLHSAVTRYSLPSYSFQSLLWSELASWVHIALILIIWRYSLTPSIHSLLYLLIKIFHFQSNSRLILWRVHLDSLAGRCWPLNESWLTHSFLPPFSCTWSLSSFSAV